MIREAINRVITDGDESRFSKGSENLGWFLIPRAQGRPLSASQ